MEEIVALHQNDPKQLLSNGRLISLIGPAHHVCPKGACDVCFQPDVLKQALNCEHSFCVECWQSHVQTQVQTGSALRIECMGHQCPLLVPADLAEWLLQGNSDAIRQYKHFALVECVQTNARVQQCPGVDCDYFFLAKQHPLSKRVQCTSCTTCCCFRCQLDYHAPTDCATIRKWMTKCADDSETANYISANTKDCPECHVCIEKNGGCNHMQCTGCKYEFCWICMGSWKGHAGHYYDCSRFKEKPGSKDTEQSNPINEARKALQKYLFYYERWDNHARSLKLEQQTLEKIKERIHEIVMKGTLSHSNESNQINQTNTNLFLFLSTFDLQRELKCDYLD